ncbi:81_t:CDS:2, partial [Racocetra persica]
NRIAGKEIFAVVLNTPQNVQSGSTIVISWSFSGVQSTRIELGIQNAQTSAITVIDTYVDLTKGSETWVVSVGAGSYKLFLMDQTSYNYYYSNTFTVSGNPSSSSSTQSSGSSSDSDKDSGSLKTKFFIAAPFILLVVI